MNWEELGDMLEEIGLATDRLDRLGEYEQILAGLPGGAEGHAEVLTCMADELKWQGRLDEAEATYRAAIDDGGRTVLSPYTGLLNVALERGADEDVEGHLAQLLAQSRADRLVVGDYEWIAESLEESGRLRTALRWFTIPLRDIQPGDIDLMPPGCLQGRYRVRRALELPIDAYDESHEVYLEATSETSTPS
jgi:tetratricopeptide (TPR) repeat protein